MLGHARRTRQRFAADPDARRNLLIRVQTLLDRAHFSPGVIDGRDGTNLTLAIKAFQASRGLTPDGEICLTVRDTGIGIASDMLPHLFMPFHRGDNSTSRRYGGTGLGLAITRRLVELHGGRIEVESALGEGTTVRIYLPAERVLADSKPADQTRIAV